MNRTGWRHRVEHAKVTGGEDTARFAVTPDCVLRQIPSPTARKIRIAVGPPKPMLVLKEQVAAAEGRCAKPFARRW